jgi:hypothetical protein
MNIVETPDPSPPGTEPNESSHLAYSGEICPEKHGKKNCNISHDTEQNQPCISEVLQA